MAIHYYIYKVHYNTYKKHIEKVMTTRSLEYPEALEKSRTQVVKDIDNLELTIYTAPARFGRLVAGAKVITEYLDGEHYIKTVRDK